MVKAYRDMALYASAELLFKATPVVIVPFLLRAISPSEFGMMELFLTVFAGFLGMLGLGAGSAIHRYYYDEGYVECDRQSIIVSSLFCVLISSVFFSIIFFLVFDGFVAYLDVTVDRETKLCLYAYALFSLYSQVLLDLVRVGRRVASYLLAAGVSKILGPILALLFVVYFSAGPSGYFLALALAAAAGFFAAFYFAFPLLSGGVARRKNILLVLAYGWPFAMMAPLQWAISGFDRFFLAKEAGLEVMGGYALAAKFSFVGVALFSAFLAAWGPAAFRYRNSGEAVFRVVHELVYACLTFVFFVGLASVAVLGRWFFDVLFPADYSGSVVYLVLLVYGAVVPLISASLYAYISLSGRTYVFLIITLIGGVGSLVLNYILIDLYGGVGAAAAVALVGGLLFYLNLFFCFKSGAPMPPFYFSSLKFLCLSMIFISVLFGGIFEHLLLAFCAVGGVLAFRRVYHLASNNKQMLSSIG